MEKKRIAQRARRHQRIRKRLSGTSDRPRLCVYRSLANLSAQLINDDDGRTVLSVSTFDKDIKDKIKYGGNLKAAEQVGKILAEKAASKGIKAVVFDRGGDVYHGRIKAFADAARAGGLLF